MVSFNRNQKEILLFTSDFMKFLLYAHRSTHCFKTHDHILFCCRVKSFRNSNKIHAFAMILVRNEHFVLFLRLKFNPSFSFSFFFTILHISHSQTFHMTLSAFFFPLLNTKVLSKQLSPC